MRTQVKFLTAILVLLCLQTAQAEIPRCLHALEAQNLLSRFEWKGPGVPMVHAEQALCNDGTMGFKILQALAFLENLPELSNTQDAFALGTIRQDYRTYFRSRVHTLVFEESEGSDCGDGQTAAFVGEEPATIHLCPQLKDMSRLEIATVLVHEARHTEGSGFAHVPCTHGDWASTNAFACDPSYEFRGAYGIEAEMKVRIARSAAVPEEMRENARALAIQDLLQNFNEAPAEIHAGMILQSAQGQVSFFDGLTQTVLLPQLPSGGFVSIVSGVPTFFDPSSGDVQMYNFGKTPVAADDELAGYFQNLPSEKRQEVRDIFYDASYSCVLATTFLHCEDGDTSADLRFQRLRPDHWLHFGRSWAFVTQENAVYMLPDQLSELENLDEDRWAPIPNPLERRGYVHDGSHQWGLQADGLLEQISEWQKPGLPSPLLQNQRFERVLGPVWFSSKLEAL